MSLLFVGCALLLSSYTRSRIPRYLVTYFGAFNGVPDNPTKSLCTASGPASLRARLSHIRASFRFAELPVSSSGVQAAMSLLHPSPPPSILPRPPPRPLLVVHLGVDGSQRSADDARFKLERRAYNELDFRVPDNDGAQPRKTPVDETLGTDLGEWLGSTLPLDAACAELRARWGGRVDVSDDAGRFVCNYTLFSTLRRAQLEGGGERACFVHVPEFGMIGEGEQGEFLADFFRTIDALLKAES